MSDSACMCTCQVMYVVSKMLRKGDNRGIVHLLAAACSPGELWESLASLLPFNVMEKTFSISYGDPH